MANKNQRHDLQWANDTEFRFYENADGSISPGVHVSGNDVMGATTDAPASATTDEDTTARSGISLLKGAKNLLIDLKNLLAGTLAVSGPLTNTELRDSAVPVSGPLTDAELRDSALAVSATQLPPALGANGGLETEALPVATPTHTAVNVTTASGEVLAANNDRLYALLINDSDEVIYLKFGAAAVANQGIRLNASGGSYEMSSAFGNLYVGAINAIHDGAGNKVLTVLEGV